MDASTDMAQPEDQLQRGVEPIPAGYVDALRMTEADRRTVMEVLVHGDGPTVGAEKRKSRRLATGLQLRAMLDVSQFQGGLGRYVVYSFDLSEGGMGVLHGAFLHEGSSCVVKFKTEDGSPIAVEGRVVRCRLIKGRIHEVGIEFTSRQDLSVIFPSLGAGRPAPASAAASSPAPAIPGSINAADAGALAAKLRAMEPAIAAVREALATLEKHGPAVIELAATIAKPPAPAATRGDAKAA